AERWDKDKLCEFRTLKKWKRQMKNKKAPANQDPEQIENLLFVSIALGISKHFIKAYDADDIIQDPDIFQDLENAAPFFENPDLANKAFASSIFVAGAGGTGGGSGGAGGGGGGGAGAF